MSDNSTCRGFFCQKYEKKYICDLCRKNYCRVCIVKEENKYFCIDCFAGLYLIDSLGLKVNKHEVEKKCQKNQVTV